MTDTFTCDHCGGTFEKAWTDEEAIAEAADTFGDQLGDDPACVCDDCYRAMTAELPIAEYLASAPTCSRCTHTDAEHSGPGGMCRAVERGLQCVCPRFGTLTADNKS